MYQKQPTPHAQIKPKATEAIFNKEKRERKAKRGREEGWRDKRKKEGARKAKHP